MASTAPSSCESRHERDEAHPGVVLTSTGTLASLLRERADRGPSRPALRLGGDGLTYGELEEAAEGLASRLTGLGIGREQAPRGRVAIIAPNVPALVVALFAVWKAGGVAVPLSARLREHELTRILADARIAAFVSVGAHQGYSFTELLGDLARAMPTLRGGLFVGAFGDVTAELPGPGREGDVDELAGIAALLYTSGTTGAPKGALVAHGPWIQSARDVAEVLGSRPEDVTLLVVPVAHAFGLVCLLATVASGGRAVMIDSTFTLEPVMTAIEASRVTILHGSPALFAGLLKARPGVLRGVRTGFVAGAVCPSGVLERLDEENTPILNLYGMTEIGAATACRTDDPPETRRTTVGRPLPGFEFRLGPVAGADAGSGELQVRGPAVTPGYYRHPELTAATFDGEWLRTGDIGSITARGDVRVSGRLKELIHVAGFNVYPAEVEEVLLAHPAVAQAAVVGVSRDDVGEAIHAFVVVRPGRELAPGALLRFARSRIAGYKLPYRIEIVPELPLLASGKPDRAALARDRVGQAAR